MDGKNIIEVSAETVSGVNKRGGRLRGGEGKNAQRGDLRNHG